jgi:hypothetical protein
LLKQYTLFTLFYDAGIGTNGRVVPINYTENGLGNLNQLIITSGKLMLEAYYSITRKEPTYEDILKSKDYIEACHFKMQHLFCYKQRLFNSSKWNTLSVKQHMMMHFPWFTLYLGAPANFNTSVMENMHIISKNAYKSSSRRRDGLTEEMMEKIQMAKVMKSAQSIYDDKHGPLVVQNIEVRVRKERARMYETEELIIYELPVSSELSEEIRYNYQNGLQKISDRFLSKSLTQEDLWNLLVHSDDEEILMLLQLFKNKTGDHYHYILHNLL